MLTSLTFGSQETNCSICRYQEDWKSGRARAEHPAGGVRRGLGAEVAGPAGRVGLDPDLVERQRQPTARLLADRGLGRPREAVVERLVDPGEVRDAGARRPGIALREREGLRDRVGVEVEPVHQRTRPAGRLEPGAERLEELD